MTSKVIDGQIRSLLYVHNITFSGLSLLLQRLKLLRHIKNINAKVNEGHEGYLYSKINLLFKIKYYQKSNLTKTFKV